MKTKLFDYIERDNFIYGLSGITKLVCFVLLTLGAMLSYDARSIFVIFLLSVVLLKVSEIPFRQVRLMFVYVAIFMAAEFVLTYLFAPQYGESIYGTAHEIFRFSSRYVVTQEQMLYQFTKVLKYFSVVPLGIIFLLTTNPSELASALNRAGISYKGAYALALTLRYFPDTIRNYQDISLAQQSRGLDLSGKEKFSVRVKNIMSICVPLIFTTMDRIDLISNAMDLRGFGKHKKRTWYAARRLGRSDYTAMLFALLVFLGTVLVSIFINHSRFWNPFA
ncbi:MAG: energy-coupling factor transporter transmembrane component T family protein [Roseburia sp.]